MSIIDTAKDLIINYRKEKHEQMTNEFKFYQELYGLFFDFVKKVENEKYADEYLLSRDELAVEGLEFIVNEASKLLKSEYLESVNQPFKQTLIKLINQSKNDLNYYQNDWGDDFDDPSLEIIESIVEIFKEAESIISG